jgi:hypothetical protein
LLASSHSSIRRERERERKTAKQKRVWAGSAGKVEVGVSRTPKWWSLEAKLLNASVFQERKKKKRKNLSVETVRPFSDSLFLVSVVVCVCRPLLSGLGEDHAICCAHLSNQIGVIALFFF